MESEPPDYPGDLPAVVLTVIVQTAWNRMVTYQLRRIRRGGVRTHVYRDGVDLGAGGKCALFRLAERDTMTTVRSGS